MNGLHQQHGQQTQSEKHNAAYRDQLLQQVSKTAAQEERNRLARDLHDSIKQQLFSIAVSAAAVKARLAHNPASAYAIVEDIERIAHETQVEMQVLLQQLRPTALENVGLIESLRLQCQALGYRTGAEVIVELGELPPDELLPIGAQEMIFRIVQEGFANIARHARATKVWLSLQTQPDALLIEIGDHGQGFDICKESEHTTAYGGMGLSNVRERVQALGGKMAIWSLPDQGTTLHICIPLLQPQCDIQEQARIKKQRSNALANSSHALRIGTWAAEVAAALILLYTPPAIALWLVLPCIIVAFSCWLYVRHNLSALHAQQQHADRLSLQAQGYGLLAGVLLLAMLSLTYLEAFRAVLYSAFLTNNILLLTALFAVSISPLIALYTRFSRYTDYYYQALSRPSLQGHLRRLRQHICIDWLMWLLVVGLTLFQLNISPSILTDTTTQYIGFILLSIWFLMLLLKSIRIIRWHNKVHREENQAQHAMPATHEQKKGVL